MIHIDYDSCPPGDNKTCLSAIPQPGAAFRLVLLFLLLLFVCGPVSASGRPVATERHSDQQRDTLSRQRTSNATYSYPTRSLTPVNTGRSVTFTIDDPCPTRFAIKTNLLYWATLTPNLSFEAALGGRTSLEISGGYHPWNKEFTYPEQIAQDTKYDKHLWHWSVRPEFRFWFDKPFSGHFIGVGAVYADYALGGFSFMDLFDKAYYYDGWGGGGTLTYGYHLKLSRSWAMEFSVGGGYIHLEYDKWPCSTPEEVVKYKTSYFGLTNAGIKMVFTIK